MRLLVDPPPAPMIKSRLLIVRASGARFEVAGRMKVPLDFRTAKGLLSRRRPSWFSGLVDGERRAPIWLLRPGRTSALQTLRGGRVFKSARSTVPLPWCDERFLAITATAADLVRSVTPG